MEAPRREDAKGYPAPGMPRGLGGSERQWAGGDDGVKDGSLLPREWLRLGGAWASAGLPSRKLALSTSRKGSVRTVSDARCPPQFAAPRQSRSPEAATNTPRLSPQHHLLTR